MMDAAHSSTLTAAQAPTHGARNVAELNRSGDGRGSPGARGIEAEFDWHVDACAHRRSHGSAAPPPTVTLLLWPAATEMMVSTTPSETR